MFDNIVIGILHGVLLLSKVFKCKPPRQLYIAEEGEPFVPWSGIPGVVDLFEYV